MPSKYSVRFYTENGIYHIYNRGVEKRTIFEDKQDYQVFLHYLKRYLSPPNFNEVRPRWIVKLHQELKLFAYCLMPNHFHLLIKQDTKTSITLFMRCLINAYTKYFNEKYERVGPLFQGKFKAVLVETDAYFLHLSRYIHLNPLVHDHPTRSDLVELTQYPYSSYAEYLGQRNTKWINTQEILTYFKKPQNPIFKNFTTYKSFVEDYAVPVEDFLNDLIIE